MTAATPQIAMPVGLPADIATAEAHFAELRLHMEAQKNSDGTGSIWVDDNPSYSRVFTVTSGMARYLPAGQSGPVGGPTTVPTLLIVMWPPDYLFLRSRAAGVQIPKFIRYTHLDPAEVTSTFAALVASTPRLHSIDAASGGNLVQDVLDNRKSLLLRSATLLGRPLVDSVTLVPTRIGRLRLDIAFLDEAGNVIDLASALNLFRAVGGPLVDAHPLLEDIWVPCTPSVVPVEGGTWVRATLHPRSTQPANARVTVSVGGVQAPWAGMSSTRDSVFAEVPSHAAGAVGLSIDISGEGVPRNLPSALTYVEEIEPTFDALRVSFRNALEFVEDRVAAATTSGPALTDVERFELEAQLDLQGNQRRGILAMRAAATGTSLFDPQVAQFEDSVYAGLTTRLSKVREDLWKGSTPPSTLRLISAQPFSGSDFFQRVRTFMDQNRGLFLGQDDDVIYACADASFHRFRLHERPSTKNLPAAVATLPASARVVSNAAFFSSVNQYPPGGYVKAGYCWTGPCDSKVTGDVYVNGVYSRGWMSPTPTTGSFGQMQGFGEQAFATSKGHAAAHVAPGPYLDGLGGMLRMISGQRDVSGPDTSYALKRMGRTFFGIHRASNTVFMAVIAHNKGARWVEYATGTNASEFTRRMLEAGVDEMVLGDGSDSVMMWVHDGSSRKLVVDSSNFVKNDTNPIAAYLSLCEFSLGNGARAMVKSARTTASGWQAGTDVTGISGILRLVDGGAELYLDSLGNTNRGGAGAVGPALGVTLPVSLGADTSNLTVRCPFRERVSGGQPLVSAVLEWPSDPLSIGALVGELLIQTNNGAVSMDVDLPLVAI